MVLKSGDIIGKLSDKVELLSLKQTCSVSSSGLHTCHSFAFEKYRQYNLNKTYLLGLVSSRHSSFGTVYTHFTENISLEKSCRVRYFYNHD